MCQRSTYFHYKSMINVFVLIVKNTKIYNAIHPNFGIFFEVFFDNFIDAVLDISY